MNSKPKHPWQPESQTIIPALPGFFLVELIREPAELVFTTIVAWTIWSYRNKDGNLETSPALPITPDDEPIRPYVISLPSGGIIAPGDQRWPPTEPMDTIIKYLLERSS